MSEAGPAMRWIAYLLTVALSAGLASRQSPVSIFTALGLSANEIAAIERGRPVTKELAWGDASEIYVLGAVHIDGSPDVYLKIARDLRRLDGAPGYLGIGELVDDTTEADLHDLTFEADDVKALKNCREGACDVQLPAASIAAFRQQIDFSRPDAVEQASALGRSMVLQMVRAYQHGGDDALGTYRDKQHPSRIADQFRRMIGRASALPDVLPELRRYLLDYPDAALPNADTFFYWEKAAFGLKPTIRVNHAVIFRGRAEGRDVGVVAIKQLYATHYFHTALDLSVCVADAAGTGRGFDLLTLKASQQDGLTGITGSLLRKAVLDKTRHALERALVAIKQTVEAGHPASISAWSRAHGAAGAW